MAEIENRLKEMKLLDMVSAKELGVGVGYSVLKVPGGWVFVRTDTSVFVPEPGSKKSPAPAGKGRKTIRKKSGK